MAGHLARRHILVNSICPGLFPSKMGDQVFNLAGGVSNATRSIPLQRAGRPQDIASACLFFAGNGGGFTTGANLIIDGGMISAPRAATL
jgi:NAD(P)-dependent dehydrogenase (short-subunit alcohol dehydrogenase family)